METTKLPTIAFLGTGSMSGAILRGLLKPGVEPDGDIRVTTRSQSSADELARLDGVQALAVESDEDANRKAVDGARVVILGVKPYMIADLLGEIKDALAPGTIVVSVAAGTTLGFIEERLGRGDELAVVRAMPNTPATLGLGVTGIAGGEHASDADLKLVRELFEQVGRVVVVGDDAAIDALSTISGSGPAYVYYVAEAMMQAAEAKGFSRDDAKTMVEGTLLGAVTMLTKSDDDAAELRRRVTSPKGTTEKAIEVLQRADFADLFARATDAALERAKQIAAEG